ncbi:MAG: polyphosphate kinase [Pseudomonadota bacterium]
MGDGTKKSKKKGAAKNGAEPPPGGPQRLADVDLSQKLADRDYKRKLDAAQERLGYIQQAYFGSEQRAVIVLEGWDAAGKGGAIRRIASAMDPRSLKVWPIGAPRSYFKERHYLARFWAKLPAEGEIAIFDRSWYGRVLVERIEGFAAEPAWRRAYQEINEFERLLLDDGVRLLKVFVHISPEEQLQRFRDRLETPAKRWKLTEDDFRNRARWDDYAAAIDDMLDETSTGRAPWRVVAGEDKRHARIEIIEAVCETLSAGLDLAPQPPSLGLVAAAADAFGVDVAALLASDDAAAPQ